jgi:DNA modification methylase
VLDNQTKIGAIEIVRRPIANLKLKAANPRVHQPRQIEQLAKSIRAFGFNVAALIDSQSNVVSGHARILAAKKLGMTEVPTVRLDHLTPAQVRAFALADNRLAENATWDDQLLAIELKELSLLDLDFSLDITGFDVAEIDMRIESLVPKIEIDEADTLPPEQPGPAVCQPGDLWLLGPHRVYCGSALDLGSYTAVMDGERATMVFADPPYNVPIDGHVSGNGVIQHREFAMATGEMNLEQFTEFLASACNLMAEHSVDGSIHYVCMDWRHCGEMLAAGHRAFAETKNICVWVKDNAGMGSQYRSQHEFIFVFKNGLAPHHNNIELGRFGRQRTNVWRYPSPSSFGRAGEEGNLLALHPTPKPVALVADAILDSSARGDIVLDPFLGSGTTVIAAERTGRRCFGVEIDPIYVDTIIRRWQRLSGKTAVHARTGRTFEAKEAIDVVGQ